MLDQKYIEMINQKYFGFPLWVWIIVSIIIVYSVYQSYKNTTPQSESKQEIKEKFSSGPDQVQDQQLENSQKLNNKPIIKIINFNTTWCGWSLRFQPEWDAFMEYVKNPENNLTHVEAVDAKCDSDNQIIKDMCEEYKVPGYPYVIVEVNGSRIPYECERTKDALVSFVSNM